ncbi:MAG: amidohydrolase family protein [Actinobacteria bacterium]|nr:amidohydrolase family protein [Actinomycetota bacterium]
MAMPTGVGAVDLMIGFPHHDRSAVYDYLRKGAKDSETKEEMKFLAEYMFKDVPDNLAEGVDPIDVTFGEMDSHGVEIGLFGLTELTLEARERYPGRVLLSLEVDPNDVMGTLRKMRTAKADHDLAAVTFFPSGCVPQVPVDDPKAYAVYATCVELDIPAIVNAGVAGPRFPSACQHVERFDQVCYDFPELRLVMRHGAEPWEELAVKLMLKWPGLSYMTSAFAPKYYPKAIVDYANTRGADKIMYAGYYPMGLSLERIFAELPAVPFRDHVWRKFLRENAMEVFKIKERVTQP